MDRHLSVDDGRQVCLLFLAAVIEAEFGARMPEIALDEPNTLTRRFTSAIDYADEVGMARMVAVDECRTPSQYCRPLSKVKSRV